MKYTGKMLWILFYTFETLPTSRMPLIILPLSAHYEHKPNRIIQAIVSFFVQHPFCSSSFFGFYNAVFGRLYDLVLTTRLINTMIRAWTKLSFLCQASNVIPWNARFAFDTNYNLKFPSFCARDVYRKTN